MRHSQGRAPIARRRRCESANDGGCNFPVDPALDWPAPNLLWSPDGDAGTVIVTSAPDVLAKAGDARPEFAQVLSHADALGQHGLYDLGARQRVQLLCLDGTEPNGRLAAIVPLGLDGFDRLDALYRFLAALHRRSVPPDKRLTSQQRARARRMLQAWDGARNGAHQQDIAEVVFARSRVSRDEWQVSSSRYAVMALLRDARAMIAGGYRKLLRHRRRS